MTEQNKTDYRPTVFLPKTDFPMRGSLPVKEPELLAHWQKMGLHQRLRAAADGKKKFILHDGPPYANGHLHIGHALNKTLKDLINRTYQMLGFDAPYVPGWDCHGLPIEWKIEEQYRAAGKDKDAVPVPEFRAECRAFAAKWMQVQSDEFQRLGLVGDWGHPYSTMTNPAEAQIVREIHKFLRNGLLYRGVRPVMWSVVEKTALAEAEVEYHEHTSTSLWIKFPVVKTGCEAIAGASVVIWTTTPWTIPANRAIAFGDLDYALITVTEVEEGALAKVGDRLVIAQALMEQFSSACKIKFDSVQKISGKDLEGTIAAHPWRGVADYNGYFDYDVPLYHGDFVTVEAGTGFVHIAPAHGEDDFKLGQKNKLYFKAVLGGDGCYLADVPVFAGLEVYKQDGSVGAANGAVIKALLGTGAMLAKRNIKHSYPHSWRSKAPLIYLATPQWFFAMDKKPEGRDKTLRELCLAATDEARWVPQTGHSRFRGMIESRPDWCISRQRVWGVPIALFINKKTGEVLRDEKVMKKIADIFAVESSDAWWIRPAQDFLGTEYKAEDYEQVRDVLDVWFESGSTHSYCLNKENGVSEWPNLLRGKVDGFEDGQADLYLEGSDQHRGWFHSSLVESCATRGYAPFKHVLTHGFALDEQGRKMSKSLGNTVAPQDVIKDLGADILRLWVVTVDYSEDLRIGASILKQTGDIYRRLRNTLRYLLGALDGMGAGERVGHQDMPELEQWVLHRLYEMDKIIRQDIADYNFSHLFKELHDFCALDLSAFYFDIRKDSLYCDGLDNPKRKAARTVMGLLFEYLTIWLAPILCFTAEEAYLARYPNAIDSIHEKTFPVVPKEWENRELAGKWSDIRDVRGEVTKAIEVKRNEKVLGSSLEASSTIQVSEKYKSVLGGMDLAEIFITSDVQVSYGDTASVVIDKASGIKCERCWKIVPQNNQHPDLCVRCDDVVRNKKYVSA